MTRYSRAELEPRDVVSRAVWEEISAGRQVFLDTRQAIGAAFPRRFPTINASCKARGIDPTRSPIPIAPAAHYHMGGIATDRFGRTSLPGLWACGEAACTGLHGANRLASNSLLEAVVTGMDVANDITGTSTHREASAPNLPPTDAQSGTSRRTEIRRIMSEHVGVIRDESGLITALRTLVPMATEAGPDRTAATAAMLITTAALLRKESRGAHFRSDLPEPDAAQAHRRVLTLDEASAAAREMLS
jgi:L-aspartate oxidase